ncbi:VOC family protein [Kribbella sp. NPDC048928]|uniref:VOC family protein n=1 Tax=Kribbella sp. NPDC048928 TaxID=3364111 RepID=UPI003723F04E
MTSRVRTVTFDAHDPYEIAGFWLQVLKAERPDDDQPGDPYAAVPADGLTVLFEQNNDEKAVKNRAHLDLEPETTRDEEVAWLLTLGATIANDHREPDGTGWVVMQDPEGNEFCVLRSASERAATS